MAEFATIGGEVLAFDPKSLTIVADGDPVGGPGNFVIGLMGSPISIAESPTSLLTRLGISTKYIQISRPNGLGPAWVRAENIKLVTPQLPGTITNSILFGGGVQIGAMEAPDQILAALRAAGSPL